MISVTPAIGNCSDYIKNLNDMERQSVSVIISPLRVIEVIGTDADKIYSIYSGCSRYHYCRNGECEYSKRSRDERRKAKDDLVAQRLSQM